MSHAAPLGEAGESPGGAKSSVGVGQPIHFETQYGPGFYWFAAYCVFSLASQQLTARVLAARA